MNDGKPFRAPIQEDVLELGLKLGPGLGPGLELKLGPGSGLKLGPGLGLESEWTIWRRFDSGWQSGGGLNQRRATGNLTP